MNLELMCMQVNNLARAVGSMILDESTKLKSADVKEKGLHNYVTYVDTQAEERLVGELSKILPTAGFIVEEDTIDKKGERYNWVVDPLDGTTNFIHHIPVYSVSIALMDGKEVILGVVYEINKKECFYAWKGSPAFVNKSEIQVSDTNKLNDSLLATGFPYHDYTRLDAYLSVFKHFVEKTRGVRRLGSAAVDLAYVACGRFDGFYEYGLNPWDVAAGAFIVQQAGGKVVDFKDGKDYIYGREIIAVSRNIYEEMMEVMKQHVK